MDAVDDDGNALTHTASARPTKTGAWEKICLSVDGCGDGYGRLRIRFCGNGTADLDCVSFMNADYWHRDDPKWRYGKLRKDLIQAIADLKPAFVRFPGGCIVEARIIAVADAYDAMTSNRSYRDVMPQEKVRGQIENGLGTQFDPVFGRVMLQMIDEDTEYRMREV